MIFQNLSQSYSKPMASIRVASGVGNSSIVAQGMRSWFWSPLAKVVLPLCSVVLVASLMLGSAIANIDREINSVKEIQYNLRNQSIDLKDEKKHLFTPEQVQLAAAEKLGLSKPGVRQVHKFYK